MEYRSQYWLSETRKYIQNEYRLPRIDALLYLELIALSIHYVYMMAFRSRPEFLQIVYHASDVSPINSLEKSHIVCYGYSGTRCREYGEGSYIGISVRFC